MRDRLLFFLVSLEIKIPFSLLPQLVCIELSVFFGNQPTKMDLTINRSLIQLLTFVATKLHPSVFVPWLATLCPSFFLMYLNHLLAKFFMMKLDQCGTLILSLSTGFSSLYYFCFFYGPIRVLNVKIKFCSNLVIKFQEYFLPTSKD